MIAITMPGNTGDMLYALPTARVLCAAHNTTCDFYTAKPSEHTRALFEYQSFINKLIVPNDYVIERRDIGTQPWLMPVIENKYQAVYHLGYRNVPDRPLHQFIAHQVGIDIPLAVGYAWRDLGRPIGRKYICISPRGYTSYRELFNNFAASISEKNIGIAVIGGKGDNSLDSHIGLHDFTGYDMLDTLSILAHSNGFVGMMSAQLALANGFPIPKIAPHDGIHWDMRHVIQTSFNSYPINPSVADLEALLDIA